MSDSASQLVEWIESVREKSERAPRVGLTRQGELVAPDAIRAPTEETNFVVEAASAATDEFDKYYRYGLTTEQSPDDNRQGIVECWQRFEFPIAKRFIDGEENVSRDSFAEQQYAIEVRVYLPTADDSIDPPQFTDGQSEVGLEFLIDQPPLPAERVAGLESEKRDIERFLAATNEEWGLAPETGAILEGPTGTGKTELVIEVCQEQFGEMPVVISGPEILSRWVGESERILRDKFEEARQRDHSVVFIDELDAIARSRSEVSQDHSAQIVAQLLVLLDGVGAKQDARQNQAENSDSLKVIASTNLAAVIDPALKRPGRLGNRPIRFGLPDKMERTAILHHYLERVRRSGKLGDSLLPFIETPSATGVSEIVENLSGVTGADIEHLVQIAAERAREDETTEHLERPHLERAMADLQMSPQSWDNLDTQQLSKFEEHKLVYLPVDTRSPQSFDVERLFEAYQNTQDERIAFAELAATELLTEKADERRSSLAEHRPRDTPVFLHLRGAEEIITAAEHGLPAAMSVVEDLHTELLHWTDQSVLLTRADPEAMTALFPPGVYTQL